MITKRNRTGFACFAIAMMLAGSALTGRLLAVAGLAATSNGALGSGHNSSDPSFTPAANNSTTPRASLHPRQILTRRQSALNTALFTPMPALTPLLATITVNIITDTVANDGFCSLREAVVAANLNTASGAAAGECPAGMPGADTINFSVSGTILLTQGELGISDALTIQGPSAPLTVSGNNATRVFNIAVGSFDVTLTGLTIANGRAQGTTNGEGGAAFGGGVLINSTGTINITNSTLVSNAAIGGNGAIGGFGLGGAIANERGATLNLINSTLSGNSATGGSGSGGGGAGGGQAQGGFGVGGGIYNAGTLNITSATLVSNSAIGGAASGGTENFVGSGSGGGIYTTNGASIASTTVRNTIIANNTASTADADVSGPNTSQGFNLIGINPQLGMLANNGGPTHTYAPLAGSPAIDQGNSFGLTVDQRGFPRPQDNPAITNQTGGDGADIGAFEVQLAPPCPTITAQISGGGTIRAGQSAILTVTVAGGTGPYTITLSNGGGTQSGNGPTLNFNVSPSTTTTYTVTAGADNNKCPVTTSGSATVTIDATLPTITCPGNQNAVIAGTTGPVTYPAPTVSDNLPGATFTCTPASGNNFPLGATTVNCTATDAVGNTSPTCNFTVTVSQTDTTPPTLICPSNQTSVINGTSGPVTYPAPMVSDNLSGATVNCTPASGSNFLLGITTVNCTARDMANNTAECSFRVVVRQSRPAVNDLLAQVRALAPSLNTAQINSLLGQLELANSRLERGQTNQACIQLRTFTNLVSALVTSGRLTTAQGQSLTSYANQIRSALGCD